MQKSSYSKIKKNLHAFNLKENNRPFIFLICLIIASILWFINSLGKEYESIVNMPVNYTNLPKNKMLVNPPPSSLQIRMKASGYTLLRHKFKLNFNPINFNLKAFTNSLMEKTDQTSYIIITNRYQKEISSQVSSEITIIDVAPDTLFFQFDYIVERQKPIQANFDLEFENQFFLEDSILFQPKFVTISGPQAVVDTIKAIKTKNLSFKRLKHSISKSIMLERIEGITIEPQKVDFTIPVSQYTEYSTTISVSKMNVPEGFQMVTFPGKVELNCLVSINDYKNINPSNFIIGVDYNSIINSKNKVSLNVLSSPPKIKALRFYPKEVEYIIESN